MMEVKKKGRKGKDTEFKWNGEVIKMEKVVKYLGYILQSNNGNSKHIEHLAGKANTMLGKIWSLGERKFRDDWRKRIKLFDALVKSVISYGAEIWGWREWKELEKIQEKYIKWTLKTDKTTPRQILHEDTRRWKYAIQFGKRAMKYEQKMIESKRGTMCREGIKSMIENRDTIRN